MAVTEPQWPYSGGEMAGRIRERDWGATPLGPIEGWPQSLCTAVDIVLAIPGPVTLLWGAAHVQLYNDAYAAIARERHPALLGRPVAQGWTDAYETALRPLIEAAEAGRAVQLKDCVVTLRAPNGRTQERVFDTAWSPVRDEAGRVAGMLQTLTEVFDRRLSEAASRASAASAFPDKPASTVRGDALATAGATLGDGVAAAQDISDGTAAQAQVLRLPQEIAQANLRDSEECLRQFGEASSDVLWIRDAETLQWIYLTPAFETIYGLDRATALSDDTLANWLDLIVPEDRDAVLDKIRCVRAGERVAFEYRICRPLDGALRWLRDTDFPIRDADGRLRWLGGVGRDITEEKAAVERQDVLVRELQHRSRNLLGVVTALSNRTIGRGAPVESFTARLKALSRAQALLSQSGSDTVAVEALVRAELAVHLDTDTASPRLTLGGPNLLLSSQQVQNVALAVHELTTNAVKYGALKHEAGRLSVTWDRVRTEGGRAYIALDWIESGVDLRPEAATRSGYGRELIERALAYALGGRTEYVLAAGGVRCRIELPLA